MAKSLVFFFPFLPGSQHLRIEHMMEFSWRKGVSLRYFFGVTRRVFQVEGGLEDGRRRI